MYADRVNVVPTHRSYSKKMRWKRTGHDHPTSNSHPASAAGHPPPPTGTWVGPAPPGGSVISNRDTPAHDVRGVRGSVGGRPEAGMPTTPLGLHAGTPNFGGGRVHWGRGYGTVRGGGGDPGATQAVAWHARVTLAECLLMVATM